MYCGIAVNAEDASHPQVAVALMTQDATRKCSVTMYDFSDTSTYVHLSSLLLQEGPIDYVAFAKEQRRVKVVVDSLETESLTMVHPALPKAPGKKKEHILRLISQNVGEKRYDTKVIEAPLALEACGMALEAFETFGDGAAEMALISGKAGVNYLRLDSTAVDAVNLFPEKNSKRLLQGKDSLYDVLNCCKTKIGAEELKQWLRRPLTDRQKIIERQTIVGAFVSNCEIRANLREALGRSIPHLKKIASALSNETASLTDLHNLRIFAQDVLPEVAATFGKILLEDDIDDDEILTNIRRDFVLPLTKAVVDFQPYTAMIDVAIDLDFLPEILLKASIDPKLTELRSDLEDAKRAVAKAHEDAVRDFASKVAKKPVPKEQGKWPLKLERDKSRGFVLRSPKSFDEKTITAATVAAKENQDSTKGGGKKKKQKKAAAEEPIFEVVTYLKNGVYMTTKQLKNAADHYADTHTKYVEAQASITKQLLSTAASYAPLVDATRDLIAAIDVVCSLAHAAVFADGGAYVRPTILDDGPVIRITAGRHPTVETTVDSFIANDYIFGGEDELLTLITGPNMGGKSTYLRGLGCLLVMAQIGSYIPADDAEVSIFDSILARVGANDNLHAGVSTFMAEMIDASTIVRLASPRSLVLIDELGRGTSTCDGFGLAWAISEYLAKQAKAICLFATHFHELTDLGVDGPGVDGPGGSSSKRKRIDITSVTPSDTTPEDDDDDDPESSSAKKKQKTTDPCAKNLHVTAQTTDDTITFLYDVVPGPCLQSFGIDVAKIAGFPERTLESARVHAARLERR